MNVNVNDVTTAYQYQNQVNKTKGAKEDANAPATPKPKATGFDETAAVFERSDATYPQETQAASSGVQETSVLDAIAEKAEEVTEEEGTLAVDREELVKQLESEAQAREQALIDMVKETLGQQVDENSTTIADILNPTEATEATEGTSEDDGGYWGVEQTAQRIVDFAKSLAGGNVEYAEKLREAFVKGYKQAEEQWGGELPQVSKNTYNRVMELFDEWTSTGSTSA